MKSNAWKLCRDLHWLGKARQALKFLLSIKIFLGNLPGCWTWKSWSTGLLINHWQLALEDLSKNTSFTYHLSEVNDLLNEHCIRNVQRKIFLIQSMLHIHQNFEVKNLAYLIWPQYSSWATQKWKSNPHNRVQKDRLCHMYICGQVVKSMWKFAGFMGSNSAWIDALCCHLAILFAHMCWPGAWAVTKPIV